MGDADNLISGFDLNYVEVKLRDGSLLTGKVAEILGDNFYNATKNKICMRCDQPKLTRNYDPDERCRICSANICSGCSDWVFPKLRCCVDKKQCNARFRVIWGIVQEHRSTRHKTR